ncbi:MAG: hypothetical protein JSS81_07115 [Acidobacteria bacterium]|nr:hypothetical protein [Acidobacteriota bacterium]
METVGQLVQEAVDFTNSGAALRAILPAAQAIAATIRRETGKESLAEDDFKRFVKQNFALITFMGMPRALPLPMNIPFGLKRIVPSFNVHHGAEEIVLLVVSETLRTNRPPAAFDFNTAGRFEIVKDKLLLPPGLVNGLLGSVIFHPANRAETIGDKYWMSISDFKMFISELWGRRALADRIMKFYLERD